MIDAGLFDERYRRCEDFDLWLRMSFRGARMGLLDRVGIERRRTAEGLSADSYLLKQAGIEIYRKTLETLPLSMDQQKLIHKRMKWMEGMQEAELARRCVRERRYAEAAAAAQKAASLLGDRKSQRLALVLRFAPWVYRQFLSSRQARAARKRKRGVDSARIGGTSGIQANC